MAFTGKEILDDSGYKWIDSSGLTLDRDLRVL